VQIDPKDIENGEGWKSMRSSGKSKRITSPKPKSHKPKSSAPMFIKGGSMSIGGNSCNYGKTSDDDHILTVGADFRGGKGNYKGSLVYSREHWRQVRREMNAVKHSAKAKTRRRGPYKPLVDAPYKGSVAVCRIVPPPTPEELAQEEKDAARLVDDEFFPRLGEEPTTATTSKADSFADIVRRAQLTPAQANAQACRNRALARKAKILCRNLKKDRNGNVSCSNHRNGKCDYFHPEGEYVAPHTITLSHILSAEPTIAPLVKQEEKEFIPPPPRSLLADHVCANGGGGGGGTRMIWHNGKQTPLLQVLDDMLTTRLAEPIKRYTERYFGKKEENVKGIFGGVNALRQCWDDPELARHIVTRTLPHLVGSHPITLEAWYDTERGPWLNVEIRRTRGKDEAPQKQKTIPQPKQIPGWLTNLNRKKEEETKEKDYRMRKAEYAHKEKVAALAKAEARGGGGATSA
jgi:hypothetical protein